MFCCAGRRPSLKLRGSLAGPGRLHAGGDVHRLAAVPRRQRRGSALAHPEVPRAPGAAARGRHGCAPQLCGASWALPYMLTTAPPASVCRIQSAAALLAQPKSSRCVISLTLHAEKLVTQGVRMPAAHELEPLEVRFPKFDLPLLQFLKARPPLCPHRTWHSALVPGMYA